MWTSLDELQNRDKPYCVYNGISLADCLSKDKVIEYIEYHNSYSDKSYIKDRRTNETCKYNKEDFLIMAEKSDKIAEEKRRIKKRRIEIAKKTILPITYDFELDMFIAKIPSSGYYLADIKKFEYWHNMIFVLIPLCMFLSYIFNDFGGALLLCFIIYYYGLYYEVLYRNNKDN